jgi:hypothetical protein
MGLKVAENAVAVALPANWEKTPLNKFPQKTPLFPPKSTFLICYSNSLITH